jgi:hypothetical protein
MDLGERPDAGVTAMVLGWVVGTQGRPGAFGEGCDRERHAQRVCEHYLGGFFAPAPPEQRLAPITLPNGKVFRSEPAARFAISCLALRAVLRAGLGAQPLVRRHLQGLAGLAELWTGWTGYYAPDLIVAGLQALALAGPAYRESVDRVVGVVAAHQAGDGTWPNADLFHVLEALLAAGGEPARGAIQRAVPPLVKRQRADGTFGTPAQQERGLIGLHALLQTARTP